MVKRIGILLACLLTLFLGNWYTVFGQAGTELLENPYFSSYYGIGGTNVVPVGWKLTSNLPVSSASHSYIYDGPVEYPGQPNNGQAWELSVHSGHFTAVGYQHVAGVGAGTRLRFSVYGNVYTCNKDNSCIENNIPYRISDKSSGAAERVGIDPTGGTDPYAASVQWSGFIAPFDVYQYVSVSATVSGDNGATVFMYATQANSMLLDSAYWYGASLQAIGGVAPTSQPVATNAGPGGAPTTGAPAVPSTAPAVPPTAPAVKPQAAQPDGSIVHTVMAGDTLSTIAYAYKTTVAQIQQLNNMNPGSSFLQVGQKLLIKPAKTAVPTITPIPSLTVPHPTITLQPGLDVTATAAPLATAPVDGSVVPPADDNATADSSSRLRLGLVVGGAISILLLIGGVVFGILLLIAKRIR